tara:strand:+ start:334 stop:615 length:282 start_codon:yes stop_codon:yes gene_type:complete
MNKKERFDHIDMTGSLFKNKYKTQENQPDYSGTAKVNGQDVDCAAWLKKTRTGETYFSFKYTNYQEQKPEPEKKPLTPPSQGDPIDLDDKIPF